VADEPSVDPLAVEELRRYFRRNGYVRWPNPDRMGAEGYRRYKKGSELRLVAESRAELRHIRALLERAGCRPGRPFAKGRQFRQPVYGHDAVLRLLDLLE
jgi:hypothetical protein